jgi:photosystem II stability/assembly factor-like uncharacterized protein
MESKINILKIMNKLLRIILLIFFSSSLLEAQWVSQNYGEKRIRAVQFFDSGIGYIVGESGFIQKLSDWGKEHTPINMPYSIEYLGDLCFINEDSGWVVGASDSAIFKTTNGGQSWKRFDTPDDPGFKIFNTCYCFVSNIFEYIWVGGLNSKIFYSNLGGMKPFISSDSGISGDVYDLYFTRDRKGYCVTSKGIFYQPPGKVWNCVYNDNVTIFRGISISSDSIGWVVGHNGTILRSSLLPDNWKDISQPSFTTNLYAVFALSDNVAYAVGDSGVVVHIFKAGNDREIFHIGGKFFESVFAINEDNIWIVGDQGANYYSEGTIQIDNTQIKDTLEAKTNQDIFFTTQFNKYVDILFSDDNGVSWKDTIAIKHLTDTGKFPNWTVPDINSTECKICIRSSYPHKKTVADTSKTFVVYTTDRPEIESIPDTLTGREGEPITICAKVKSKWKPITVELFYRQGGDLASRYKNVEMDTVKGSPNSYKQEIIPIHDFEIGKYGVEFYIEASYNIIKKINSTYPYTNARENPCSIPILVQNLEHEIVTSEPGHDRYQMLSIPLNYQSDTGTIRKVLFDDMGESYDKHNWRLFKWKNGRKIEYPDPSISWEFKPGRAFWIVSRFDLLTTGEAYSVIRKNGVIPLEGKGWHQVANPFAYEVPVDSIKLDSSKIDGGFNKWNMKPGKKGSYISSPDSIKTLQPFEGYFIKTLVDSVLFIIPPINAERIKLNREIKNPITWQITLKIQNKMNSETTLIFGQATKASDQFDRLDWIEPPLPYKPMLKGYIPHPDWQIFKGDYQADIRALKKEGDFWDFNIESENTGFIDLTFDLDNRIPINHQVILLPNDSNQPQYLNENPHYRYRNSVKGSVKQFRLIVGTQKYIAEQVTHHKPTQFTLFQNYPNPFNTTTTIRYTIPIAGDVSLQIYNVLGEKVAILLDNVQKNAGFYSQIWNGTDSNGNEISSGLYFYQINTASFSETKKMIIIK